MSPHKFSMHMKHAVLTHSEEIHRVLNITAALGEATSMGPIVGCVNIVRTLLELAESVDAHAGAIVRLCEDIISQLQAIDSSTHDPAFARAGRYYIGILENFRASLNKIANSLEAAKNHNRIWGQTQMRDAIDSANSEFRQAVEQYRTSCHHLTISSLNALLDEKFHSDDKVIFRSTPKEFGASQMDDSNSSVLAGLGELTYTRASSDSSTCVDEDDAMERRAHDHHARAHKKVYWESTQQNDIPYNAIPVGQEKDGQPIYAARAFFQGSLVIGKAGRHLLPIGAHIPYNSLSYAVERYEILVGDPHAISWKKFNGFSKVYHDWDPVEGGYEVDGEKLLVGVTYYHGSTQVGQVSRYRHSIQFAYKSEEIENYMYTIAAYRKE